MHKFTSHIIPVEVRRQVCVVCLSGENLADCPWPGYFWERQKMDYFCHLLIIFFWSNFQKKSWLEKNQVLQQCLNARHFLSLGGHGSQVNVGFEVLQEDGRRSTKNAASRNSVQGKMQRSYVVWFCCHTKFLIGLSALSALFLRDKMYIP